MTRKNQTIMSDHGPALSKTKGERYESRKRTTTVEQRQDSKHGAIMPDGFVVSSKQGSVGSDRIRLVHASSRV